jgi:hypothetical protein
MSLKSLSLIRFFKYLNNIHRLTYLRHDKTILDIALYITITNHIHIALLKRKANQIILPKYRLQPSPDAI